MVLTKCFGPEHFDNLYELFLKKFLPTEINVKHKMYLFS